MFMGTSFHISDDIVKDLHACGGSAQIITQRENYVAQIVRLHVYPNHPGPQTQKQHPAM